MLLTLVQIVLCPDTTAEFIKDGQLRMDAFGILKIFVHVLLMITYDHFFLSFLSLRIHCWYANPSKTLPRHEQRCPHCGQFHLDIRVPELKQKILKIQQ